MESGDDWLAMDKLYHVFFSFFITIFVSTLASQTRYAFISRWSIWIGCLVSLAVGAAKEAGDEIGLWSSAGASVKDATADLFGILIASASLSRFRSFFSSSSSSIKKPEELEKKNRGISLV